MPLDHDTLLRFLLADRVKLIGFIRCIVRDDHLAEDVFQEVSMLVLGKSPEILDAQHFLAWVRRAARLEALSMLRRHKARTQPLDEAVLDALEADWAKLDRQPSLDLLEAVEHCMAKLTPRARAILELRHRDGLIGPKLAEALDQPLTTVYVTLSRAHRALGDCIRNRAGMEGA